MPVNLEQLCASWDEADELMRVQLNEYLETLVVEEPRTHQQLYSLMKIVPAGMVSKQTMHKLLGNPPKQTITCDHINYKYVLNKNGSCFGLTKDQVFELKMLLDTLVEQL